MTTLVENTVFSPTHHKASSRVFVIVVMLTTEWKTILAQSSFVTSYERKHMHENEPIVSPYFLREPTNYDEGAILKFPKRMDSSYANINGYN